ncbi:hypothetical protein [Virgibacillus oceani]|uniref:Uncharacterized protein n=1 Tax=Virgibacillus oceani TaxID=1479511 RepID=A0A917HRL8_9BACI|nr:hypothetical protein [Virgibacillus oceani]GGG88010.1 hypothetical protein GCM10011398_37480 [Virgibacillus oceani]
MTFPLFVVLLTIFMLAMLVIGQTIYYRNEITKMSGMMIAMGLGMSVGLAVGIIMGIMYSGTLFISTVLGMTIGFTAGFLSGIPINMIAVLDGMLAGIMGGMMGAMLGYMISPEYSDAIVKIMFMLFIATSLILLYIVQEEVNKNRSLFKNLFIITILFLIFLVGFNQTGPIFQDMNGNEQHEKKHS